MTTNPTFAFSTLHDAAVQLRGAAKRHRELDLHPLPYARFDPEGDHTWWLTQSGKNPAYAEGKIVVEHPLDELDGGVLIGLHVEKGVGPSAARALEGRGDSLVMTEHWVWHEFLGSMGSGAAEDHLSVAKGAAADLPLRLLVVGSTASPPKLERDDWKSAWPVERVVYDVRAPGLKRIGPAGGDLLRRFGVEEALPSIAEKITQIPQLDWQWVEILVGIPFARDLSKGLPADEVWRAACAPWLRWVK